MRQPADLPPTGAPLVHFYGSWTRPEKLSVLTAILAAEPGFDHAPPLDPFFPARWLAVCADKDGRQFTVVRAGTPGVLCAKSLSEITDQIGGLAALTSN